VSHRPPHLPRWLIRLCLSRQSAEVILGDLDEEFHVERIPREGRLRAHLWYWRQAVASLAAGTSAPRQNTHWLRSMAGDARIALRTARKHPGFTLTAALTLGLGIASSTIVFSVVHAVLLRPLPYRSSEALTLIWQRLATTEANRRPMPAVDIMDLERRTTLFEGFAAVQRPTWATVSGTDAPQHITMARASVDLFRLLGVDAAVGRAFDQRDQPNGGDAVLTVLLSYELWQRVYGGDSTIVNRGVQVNGQSAIVVGVLPRQFRLVLPPDVGMPETIDAWIPMSLESTRGVRETQRLRDQDSDDTGAVVARLRSGATLTAAQTQLDAAAAHLRETVPFYREAGLRLLVFPMHTDVTAHARPVLTALMGAVILVLLIACANVANLMLSRAAYRRREMALRAALGATRTRLMTHLIAEASVIGVAGGLLGVGLAAFATDLFATYRPAWLPAGQTVSLNTTVLGFAAGVTGIAVVAFGLPPAWQARSTGNGIHVRGGPERRGGMRMGLVAAEIALSTALLIGAGLLLRTATRLAAVDPGFDATGVLVFDLTLRNTDRYRGPAARSALVRDLEARLRDLPGVAHAGLVSRPPLSGRLWTTEYGRPGQAFPQWPGNEANFRMITGAFFDALRIPLLAGQTFGPAHDRQDRRFAIIDRAMADRLGLDTAAVGEPVGFPVDGERVWGEIVGVVENVRYESLTGGVRETIYVPYRHEASRDISFVVRTDVSDPTVLAGRIRHAVTSLDPALPVHGLRPLAVDVRQATAPMRFTLVALSTFAVAALLLAAIGLYGVVSFNTARRRHELGVRIALGAGRTAVIVMVVRQYATVAIVGIAGGLLAAAVFGNVLRSLLFQVAPADPATMAVVSGLIFAVALLASFLPARRASLVDPVTALRPD